MNFPRRLLLALLLIGCALRLPAQGGLDWMTSRAWRLQNGLPDQVIQAIAQTPDHYLWLGTKLGLVRFDGSRFVDYGAETAPVLHDFGVDCITVARDGSLWLGTQGGGAVHLSTGGVRTYAASAGLTNGLVRTLYEDEAGRVWAGTDNGLYRLDSVTDGGHFVRVDDAIGPGSVGVHAIIGDGHGGVWAGGTRLIHVHSGGSSSAPSWEETKLPRQPVSIRIWRMALAQDGSLWIATLAGLYRRTSDGVTTKESRIPGSTVSLHLDGQQRLWVGTLGDGLYLIDRNGSLSHSTAPSQLASNAVLAITEDMSRDTWVGTQSGLTRFRATGMHLTRVPGAINEEFGSVAVDADRSLWVCSRQLIHMRMGRADAVSLPSLAGVPIRSVMRDRAGDFWVGTLGRGAYRLAPNGRIEHYTKEIGTNYIRGFVETQQGDVWIASDGGVARWSDGRVISYQDVAGSPHAPVTAMAAGAAGELWVGTYQGLSLLQDGVYVSSPATVALGNHMVWALHRSEDGSLWIGTEGGLFLWRDGSLVRLPIDSEMGGKTILSILEDGRGRIWLGGPTNVLRASRTALELKAKEPQSGKPFTPDVFAVARETGVELGGGTVSSAALDGADGAWFASHEGPLHIEADEAPLDDAPPPIVLRQISVDGRPISDRSSVTLQPGARALEIDASLIVLSARAGLIFRRKLIGFDTEWMPIASTQPAFYTNLPPGNYTYRIEAGWNGSPAMSVLELPITQRARFYRQPWFLLVCGALVLLIVWLIQLLRVRQVTMRFRIISEERNRVAREIHDTVVQSCIGISSLLEAVAVRQTPESADSEEQQLLDTAREQIALTIVEARDAVWGLRNPRDGRALAFALRAMLHRMTAHQDVLAEFESEGTPTLLDNETEHELLMTTREALHNAITHADPTKINLELLYEPERLTIRIRDDGRGFEVDAPSDSHSRHFGMIGMRERMERISGSCTIESVPGRGAEILLELSLRSRLPRLQGF